MKVGDIVMYCGMKTAYAGRSPINPDKYVGELIDTDGGWSRDSDVPPEYEAKYKNRYYFVKVVEDEGNYQIF